MFAPHPAAAHLSALVTPHPGPPPVAAFLPAGFPDLGASATILERAVHEGGASLIELGIPHATPHLDGPHITQAHQQALDTGTALADVLALVRHLSRTAPVLVMTYAEPARRYGLDRFAADLTQAGAAGALIADIPESDAAAWHAAAATYGLHAPRVLSPDAREAQITHLARASTGLLYLPASSGPTGSRGPLDLPAIGRRCAHARLHRPPPLLLYGGIQPETAADIAPIADAMAVGSPLVRALLDHPGPQGADDAITQVHRFTTAVRSALTPPPANSQPPPPGSPSTP